MKAFALGDIHGCNRTLQLMLEQLALQAGDELICLGDYIDRGPDSKGVVDTLLALQDKGIKLVTMRGNHEELLLRSDDSRADYALWVRNGGDTALASFAVQTIKHLPAHYLRFFKETAYFHATGNFICVHAGLNFHLDDPLQDKHAMLWTRETFSDTGKIGGKRVVHGHTPIHLKRLKEKLDGPLINIDGGCVYGRATGYGYLVAMNLDDCSLVIQEHAG